MSQEKVEIWRCIKCTTKNIMAVANCVVCNAPNLNMKKEEKQDDVLTFANKLGLTKEEATQLLVIGYIDELSIEFDIPEVPVDIERTIKLFALRSFEWDQNHLEGNFFLSGYMNEYVERTSKGHGCWENILLSQTIEAEGCHIMKLKVKEIIKTSQIIVGIIESQFAKNYLPYKFSHYPDKAVGEQINVHHQGQMITLELDFTQKIDLGLLIIKLDDILLSKTWFEFRAKRIRFRRRRRYDINKDDLKKKSTFKLALAMGGSGLKLELVHYGC